MRRWLCLWACLALAACEPSEPAPSASARRGAEDAPRDEAPTRVVEQTRAAQASMTLSVRRVSQPGWEGRLVVASFSPGAGRRARVLPSERPRPLDAIVAERSPPQPFAAIDGGFYDPHGEPMGLVRTGGEDRHPLTDTGGSGVFLVEDGRPRIVHRDAYASRPAIHEALQSIDRLVSEGESLVSASASRRRAARSAVALDADGGLHLVVAFDERAVADEGPAHVALGAEATRTGPTLGQMARLLIRAPEEGGVGAVEALGLDGGLSTSLVVKSAERSLRIEPYRATINALLVTAAED